MANYSPSSEKALQIAEKCRSVETKTISKIFKNIKEKGILDKNIDIEVTKEARRMLADKPIELKDYIDQFIYYRKLRGYTQEQVGQVIGVKGKTYCKYEKRLLRLNDIDKINKVAAFLKIEESLKIPNTIQVIENKELKKYLIENNINNTEFSRLINVSRRSVVDWFNKNKKISEDNYKTIQKFISDLELQKNSKI